ncbi:hypothetical protein U9M48_014719 [Paspalum notatum var. saurae]|uniref:BURP domain-containing protein n=1 Tax=Paspalum notatum var. saurae TaxID=547442 RepID=A0AAQ3T243_PASNO
MACLLVLVVAATLLMAPPGKLTNAARTTTTSPAEEFWRTALPGAPMPEAIRELLRPAALGTTTNAPNDDDPPIPPMNFKYDDYRSSRRRDAAAVPSPDVLLNKRAAISARRSDAAAASSLATIFFLEEAVRVGEALPFLTVPTNVDDAPAARPPLQLHTVRAVRAVNGCRFVVCRRREAAGPRGAVYGCRATGPATRAYAADVSAGEREDTVAAAIVCHADDTSPWGPVRAVFRLLDVKPGDAAVCHAVLGAEVLPVEEDERRPSSA